MKPNEHYVRILSKDSTETCFVGSGILVNNSTVISCLHVIERESYDDDFEILMEIPESYYSSSIPLSNPQIFAEIDLVIFSIDTPLDFLDHPVALMKSGYSRLEGEECSVYIDFGQFGEGEHGWTFSRIEKHTSSYLIQSTKSSGKYLPVDEGHSGTAVWYKNKGVSLLVGMVKSADGEDSFDFISGQELIQYLDNITLEHIEIKNLYLPTDYIRLERYFNKGISFINHRRYDKNRILLIHGVSGIGKTTLTVDLVKNLPYEFEWLDCRLVDDLDAFREKINSVDASGYLILDSLDDSHNFFNRGWLEKAPKPINYIITTSNKFCQNKIKKYDEKFAIECIELNGFNREESFDLFKGVRSDYVDDHLKGLIYQLSKGVPIFLQLIKDIILSDIEEKEEQYNSFSDNKYIFRIIDQELTDQELSEILIKEWFGRTNIHELKKEILYVLSRVSSLGMTIDSIHNILSWDKVQINKTFENLRKKGFISPESDPKSGEMLIRSHDLIKKIATNIKGFDNENYERRFFNYIQSVEHEKCSLVTKIDALILKMKNFWEKSNDNTYHNNYIIDLQEYSNRLDLLIPSNTSSNYKLDWIASLFAPLTTEDCTILIPLSRAMCNLKSNEVLADLAWSALNKNIESEEKDSYMARANLICCAFKHWKNLSISKDLVLKKAKDHLISLEIHQKMKNVNDPDLEASMIIGGICSMGMQKEAIQIVSEGHFVQFSNEMDLSYLMIIVSLCQGYINEDKNKMIEEFVRLKLHCTTENEAKDDVIDYLLTKGFSIDKSKFKNNKSFYVNYQHKPIVGLSTAIAKVTDNTDFKRFIEDKKGRSVDIWV